LLRQNTAKTGAKILAAHDAASFAASAFHSFSQLVRNISTAENFEFSDCPQSLAAHKFTWTCRNRPSPAADCKLHCCVERNRFKRRRHEKTTI
jgi:hypothetical protein